MFDTEYKNRLYVSDSNDDARIIRINVHLSDLREWCIALMMTRYGFEPLTLSVDGFTLKIQLYVGKSRGRTSVGYYFESANQGRLEVDTDYVDNWLAFFLHTLKNGGEFEAFFPDHIDERFSSSKHEKKSKEMYLTMSWDA
jgi:hypothetical protein